jgi:hypothetical protein
LREALLNSWNENGFLLDWQIWVGRKAASDAKAFLVTLPEGYRGAVPVGPGPEGRSGGPISLGRARVRGVQKISGTEGLTATRA